MNEQPDRPDMVLELLGERQGLPHQSGNPLPQGVVQALDITRQAAVFAHGLMSFARNHRDVGLPKIGVDFGALSIDRWDGLP